MVISYVTFKILFVRDRNRKLKKLDLNGQPLGKLWLVMSKNVLELLKSMSFGFLI